MDNLSVVRLYTIYAQVSSPTRTLTLTLDP